MMSFYIQLEQFCADDRDATRRKKEGLLTCDAKDDYDSRFSETGRDERVRGAVQG